MNELPKRKPNRLINYDYSSNGAYFITICSNEHKCIFSRIVGADIIRPCEVKLTKYGKVIETAILSISKHYENVVVDKYVIMPNHVHLIIRINNVGGRMISAPTVIGQMKRWVSIKFGKSIWQKGYYDHIIRDDDDYLTKCKYIENNPEKWCEDKYYII